MHVFNLVYVNAVVEADFVFSSCIIYETNLLFKLRLSCESALKELRTLLNPKIDFKWEFSTLLFNQNNKNAFVMLLLNFVWKKEVKWQLVINQVCFKNSKMKWDFKKMMLKLEIARTSITWFSANGSSDSLTFGCIHVETPTGFFSQMFILEVPKKHIFLEINL